jgi:hypothetical protein
MTRTDREFSKLISHPILIFVSRVDIIFHYANKMWSDFSYVPVRPLIRSQCSSFQLDARFVSRRILSLPSMT